MREQEHYLLFSYGLCNIFVFNYLELKPNDEPIKAKLRRDYGQTAILMYFSEITISFYLFS